MPSLSDWVKMGRIIFILINFFRLIPHLICFYLMSNRTLLKEDLRRWVSVLRQKDLAVKFYWWVFVDIMAFFPEYRNLFYARLTCINKLIPHLLKILCPPLPNLNINAREVGSGFYIQHGFATIIAAKSIGKNCWVSQQVTIGYSNSTDCPTLGDNVTVYAGAKIIGKVTVGNNVIIGANAVVVKDVPPNCTVVGVPAYIVRKNGIKMKESL
jgi:serine O-acetyltransferase